MKERKLYERPVVQKVNLSLHDAILTVCHSSPNLTPAGDSNCAAVGLPCSNPPGI